MKLITRETDYAVKALSFMAEQKERIISVSQLVKELKIPKQTFGTFNTQETFNSSINIAENQKQFLVELGSLITKYQLTQLTVNYKK